VSLVDVDDSAPRARSKTRIAVTLAAALVAGVGLMAVIHARSSGSNEAASPKNIAPREESRPQASVAIPSPPAPAEAPATAASVEAPSPVASVEAPPPVASVEAPSPAPSVEAPAPAEKKGPSAVEKSPSETAAAQKPAGASPAAAPRGERAPETDLSGLQPSKPTKVESRADDDALQQALAQAAASAKGCRDATSPTGVASVSVTIAGSGDATGAVVQGPPFAHTMEGECIAAKFRAIHIPAFKGDSINVRKSVSLQ
jgi:DNA polymerase-3 subunit gamma/tau